MHCRECGSALKETAAFCPGCGHATRRGTSSGGSRRSVYGGASTAGAPGGTLAVGQVIDGKYRIEVQLGSGGMGTVYRTTRLHIGDEVALKVLWRQEGGSADGVERLRREAGAAARLKHPNAAAVHDLGVSADGLVYLAMEMVEGETLRDVLARGVLLAPTRVVEIAEQVCAALEEAHRQHVVHRDIKPENVMVREVGGEVRVKVLDFGIAKMTDSGPGAANLTQTGTISGTPFYMSPEQCLGEEIDGRSDIYSLGIVLYELLSGSVPFRSGTATAVVLQHVNQAPGGIRQINIGVPETIERAVLRSLAKRREDRPQTATAFAQELRAALGGAGGTATITMSKAMAGGGYAGTGPSTMGTPGTTGTRSGPSMQELFETGNQPAQTDPSWKKPAIVVGAMAALVVVGVVVGYLITGAMGESPAPANNAARSASNSANSTSAPAGTATASNVPAERQGTVTGADVNVRSEASLRAAPVGKVSRGDNVVVLAETQGSATERQLAVGVSLSRVGGGGSATMHKGIGVEVLSEGAGNAFVRATIKAGTFEGSIPVSALSPISSWVRIRTMTGMEGWVSAAFVHLEDTSGTSGSGDSASSPEGQWPEFWARFSQAVAARDRTALKGMMATPFESGGGSEDTPDEWIAAMDSYGFWDETQQSVASGTKGCPPHFPNPKSSCRITKNDHLIFEYKGGTWRWSMIMGD